MGKGPEGGLQQAGHTERELCRGTSLDTNSWPAFATFFLPTPLPYPMSTSKSSEIRLPEKFLPPNNFEHEMVVCQLHDQKTLQSVSGITN